MTSDPMLLGVDVATPSQNNKKVKIAGCIFSVLALTVMLLNSHTPVAPGLEAGASETDALAVANARSTGYSLPRTNMLRSEVSQPFLQNQVIGSSALAKLAIAGIHEANQCRDISVKATSGKNPVMKVLASMSGPDRKQVVRMSEAVKAQDMSGVIEPTGFFDPLGFSTNIDQGKLLFFREVELKHGRICMLAALGILVGENFHPLFGGNIDSPAITAFQQTPLQAFWPIVVLAIAVPEIMSFDKYDTTDTSKLWILKDGAVPGDLGYDPLGLKPSDPQEFKEMQTKEINNGRLAMIGTAGMIAQELVDGEKILDHLSR